jgi:hypothetical protein
MERSFVLIVFLLAARATGGLIANWLGLGRATEAFGVEGSHRRLGEQAGRNVGKR